MSYKARHASPGLGAKASRGARAVVVTAAAAGAAGAVAMGAAPASAAAASAPVVSQNEAYQFASNEANGNWQMSDSPISNSAGTESLSASGVSLAASGDNANGYGSAAIVYKLGTLSQLFDSNGNYVPPTIGSTGATPYVNFYVDTNGDGYPLSFSYNGAVYEGPGGDNLFIPPTASTGTIDTNGWAQGNPLVTNGMTMKQVLAAYQGRTDGGTKDPTVWASIGVQSSDKTTVTTTLTSVNDEPLTESVTGPGEIKNAYSGKCLDVTGGLFADGTKLQQWTCGVKNPSGVAGGDQQFEVVKYSNGAGALVAVDGSKQFYVDGGASGSQLTLNGAFSPSADMLKSGPYYMWPEENTVADDAGQSTANGGKVISYTLNDGTNQQWSLP